MQKLAFFGLLGGASSLVSIPALDDWAFRFVHRKMLSHILPADFVALREEFPSALPERPARIPDRTTTFFAMPFYLTGWMLRRAFRNVFSRGSLEDAAERASLIFHEGYLLDRLFEKQAGMFLPSDLGRLQRAVYKTLEEHDPSAVRRIFAQSLRLGRPAVLDAAQALPRLVRKKQLDTSAGCRLVEEHQILDELAAQTGMRLTVCSAYLESLEQSFNEIRQRL